FAQIVSLYYRYAAENQCQAEIPRKLCFVRMLGSTVLPSIVVVHTAITLERGLVTFSIDKRARMVISRVILGISVAVSIVYGFFTYQHEPLEGTSPYCSAITTHSEWRVALAINGMFFLDIVTVVGTLAFWRINKKAMSTGNFDSLDAKYSRIMNNRIIVNTLYIEILHSLVYAYLFVVYALAAYFKLHTKLDHFYQNVVTNVSIVY
ncbi:hypothetical protein PMAYCL1PPCAC_15751, partial [Pristionchus mayeri]